MWHDRMNRSVLPKVGMMISRDSVRFLCETQNRTGKTDEYGRPAVIVVRGVTFSKGQRQPIRRTR